MVWPMATPERSQSPQPPGPKPGDDQIDVYGLTHMGKVRRDNQDHFLICSLHKRLDVHLTSLPDVDKLHGDTDRLVYLAMVADGVGGGPSGEEASRRALEIVSRYVAESMNCYYTADPTDDETFTKALSEAAMHCHADLLKSTPVDATRRGMATTLTLWLGVWPRIYVLQVGDSRYYRLRDGELTQISRDQTMAQALVDQGVFSRTDASKTPLANVLSSSIGGSETTPVVTALDAAYGHVHLLCSDGLTKHVSDERIAERLRAMTSARQACEDLLQDALDDGGTDNITIIVGGPGENPR